MKNFHLDFVAEAGGLRGLRLSLLVLGLLAAAGVWTYQQTEMLPRTQLLNLELARQKAELTPPAVQSTLKPADLLAASRRVQAISDQLNLPWSGLFASMGKASSKESLAFLTIEPDAIKGQIVVVAEARDLDAMLKFFKAMQDSQSFSDVTLQSHLINHAVAEKPVRFRLSARWKLKG
ncbi:MAG: hypothetical protein WCG50_03835 [Rhodoferax sp.]|uniref:hypothetical protein n=1 Tax=Rhodoferax sp. TaxID=50421 RepID=UPI0030194211